VDDAQIKRTIVALTITAPNSIRAIEDLIPIIYPGVTRSFGYIQGLQIEAQRNAKAFNRLVDLSRVFSLAIDEVFCQNNPVLAAIDLDSGFLTSLSHETHRDAPTWGRVLGEGKAQGMMPLHIVKDGATGMAKAVNDIFPDAKQRDDVFHALYIASKAVAKVEKRAYRLIDQEGSLIKALQKAKEDQKEALAETLKSMIVKCDKAIVRYEQAESALRHLHQALRSVHTSVIDLMSPDAAQALLALSTHFFKLARHPDCDTAARYINNRLKGLTLATVDFDENQLGLCELYSQDLVAHACYIGEYKRSLKKLSKQKQQDPRQRILDAHQYIETYLTKKKSDELVALVEWLLDKRHRASSAIEGFNALLRPYRYVRKGVNQGFLELFRAWHNLRTRRSGKHKGTSAYETLTGNKVDDWLTILGFPPSSTTH
jgi:exonuclease VII small subunit